MHSLAPQPGWREFDEAAGARYPAAEPDHGDRAEHLRAAGDVELRECLASRGIERAGRFTWERAAGEFAALYRRIASAG